MLIADDSAAFRRALKVLLESIESIHVVAEAKNGRDAVNMAARLRPHVVIMDIRMPILNGLKATRQITDSLPKTKVLIISAHLDPEYVEEAIRCGARGYLSKNSAAAELAKAVHELRNGGLYFEPLISSRLKVQCRDVSAKRAALRRKRPSIARC